MPAGAAIHIVTGVPFTTTPSAGTSTFTITGKNVTSMFNPNAILTITGTNTSNDGYYQVVSSTFTGGNTVVTVVSYSTGTAYPGTVPFVSSGAGLVIWFMQGTNGPQYQDVIPSSWTRKNGAVYGDFAFFTVLPGVSSGAIATGGVGANEVIAQSGTSPWTYTPIGNNPIAEGKIGTHYYNGNDYLGGGSFMITTDPINVAWTDVGVPDTFTGGFAFQLVTDSTNANLLVVYTDGSSVFSSRFNGSGWDPSNTVTSGSTFTACKTSGSGQFAVAANGFVYGTSNNGNSWFNQSDDGLTNSYSSIAFDGTHFYGVQNGTVIVKVPYNTTNFGTNGVYTFGESIETPVTIYTIPTNKFIVFVDVVNSLPYASGQDYTYSDTWFDNATGGPNVASLPYIVTLSGSVTETRLDQPPSPNSNFDNQIFNDVWYTNPLSFIGSKYYTNFFNQSPPLGDTLTSSSLTGPWTPALNSPNIAGSDLFCYAGDLQHKTVAVGDWGTIIYSTDSGNTWTDATGQIDAAYHSVAYGGGKFVAVGTAGSGTTAAIAYSSNGSTWTDASSNVGQLYRVAYNSTIGAFVAIGLNNGVWLKSTNGSSWSSFNDANFSASSLVSLNDRFIALGNYLNGGTHNPLGYSTNGSTQTHPTGLNTSANITFVGAAYDGTSTYVAVGYNNDSSISAAAYSTGGSTWSYASGITANINFNGIAFGNGKFVAVGPDVDNTFVSFVSTNGGVTWTKGTATSFTNSNSFSQTCIAYDGSKFLVALSGNVSASPAINQTILTSTDGVTWTHDSTTTIESGMNAIFAEGGLTIAVGNQGTLIIRSNTL